ncbi:hypothetical protein FQZ97_351640 [compost metagenome]
MIRIDLDADLGQPGDEQGAACRRLWAEVLRGLIADCKGPAKARREACDYLNRDRADLARVLTMAGIELSADAFADRLLALADQAPYRPRKGGPKSRGTPPACHGSLYEVSGMGSSGRDADLLASPAKGGSDPESPATLSARPGPGQPNPAT